MCPYCEQLFPWGEFQVANRDGVVNTFRYCRKCTNYKRKDVELADKRAIAKASRELVTLLNASRAKDGSADLPAIVDRFKQRAGGVDAVADMLFADFQRVRGENLPPEERKHFEPKEQIIQKYHTLLLRAIADKDERSAQYDLSSLSEDDLRSILLPLAADLIRSDLAFRAEVVSLVRSGVAGNLELEAEDGEFEVKSQVGIEADPDWTEAAAGTDVGDDGSDAEAS